MKWDFVVFYQFNLDISFVSFDCFSLPVLVLGCLLRSGSVGGFSVTLRWLETSVLYVLSEGCCCRVRLEVRSNDSHSCGIWMP